jgi:hypothetical protein
MGQRDGRKPFLKSIKFPSPFLETKEKMLTEDGLQTFTSIPICSVCHRALEENYYFCHHCQRILCEDCKLMLNNRTHCEDCVREYHVDISRRDYFVMVSLANGLKEFDKVSKIISATKEEVRASVTTLLSSNLVSVDNKCLGLLYDYQLTDQGQIALQVYRRIYGKEEDAVLIGNRLRDAVFLGSDGSGQGMAG